MRAERNIKAANLAHCDLKTLVRSYADVINRKVPVAPPSPEVQRLLSLMDQAQADVRSISDMALHGIGVTLDAQHVPLEDLYQPPSEAEQLFSLDRPSLRALSHILRHKELWPEGFVWNYSSCSTCAMGLAWQIWNMNDDHLAYPLYRNLRRAAEVFSMPLMESCTIFGGYIPLNLDNIEGGGIQDDWTKAPDGGSSMGHVTPEMVADKIDEYLAGVK